MMHSKRKETFCSSNAACSSYGLPLSLKSQYISSDSFQCLVIANVSELPESDTFNRDSEKNKKATCRGSGIISFLSSIHSLHCYVPSEPWSRPI